MLVNRKYRPCGQGSIAHSFRGGARACRDRGTRANSPASELGGHRCRVRGGERYRCRRRRRPLRAGIVSSHERGLVAALGDDHGGRAGLLGAMVRASPIQPRGFRKAQRSRRLHRLDRRSALRRPARLYDGHRVAALRGFHVSSSRRRRPRQPTPGTRRSDCRPKNARACAAICSSMRTLCCRGSGRRCEAVDSTKTRT